MAGDKKKKKKVKKVAPPPKKPPPVAPAAVGRDAAPNVLQDGEVFILVNEPAIADDEYLLVPLKKDSKKPAPTVSKSKVGVHTAHEFANIVMTRDFRYDLIHVRAGKSKNRIRGNLPGSSLPIFAAAASSPAARFPEPKKKLVVDETPKDEDLKDERVTDFGTLEAEEPEV